MAKEIKQRVLDDFRQIAFAIKEAKQRLDNIEKWHDALYKHLLANGNIVFKDKNDSRQG